LKGRVETLKEMEYDNFSTWKKHSPWIYRIALTLILLYASLILILDSMALTYEDQQGVMLGLALASLLCFALAIFFLQSSFAKMRLAWRAGRRAHGHYTKSEQIIVDERKALFQSQHDACELSSDLRSGSWRPLACPWNVVVKPGEEIMATAHGNYSRFYGTDVSYMQSSGFFMGNAAFVLLGVAATTLGNRARRRQAEAMAQQQWREQQSVYAIVTNCRVLCQKADGTWLSFYYSGVTSMDVDSTTGTLILQFPDTQPLMLGGAAGLFCAVAMVWILHGRRGLESHPGLQHLRNLQQSTFTPESLN